MIEIAYELANKISLRTNVKEFPQNLAQKVEIHELTHRGMKFLATHNPEGFKVVMEKFTTLFEQRPQLVLDNVQAKEFLDKKMEAVLRFEIPPVIDEAAADLIAAMVYKKINNELPPKFTNKHRIGQAIVLWELEINEATKTFFNELEKIDKHE